MDTAFDTLQLSNPVPPEDVPTLTDSAHVDEIARSIMLQPRGQTSRRFRILRTLRMQPVRVRHLSAAGTLLAACLLLFIPGRTVVSAAVDEISSWFDSGSGTVISRSGAVQGVVHTDGIITSAVPDGHDGWFIAGTFTSVNGEAREHLAHLEADGALDPDWRPTLEGSAPPRYTYGTLALASGQLYVGGSFSTVDGKDVGNVAALDAATGGLVSGWQTTLSPSQEITALAADGSSLFVAGGFDGATSTNSSTIRCRLIAVKTANGESDPGFAPSVTSAGEGGGGCVQSLAVSSGDLLVGGSFDSVDGHAVTGFAPLSQTTGAIDPTFPSVRIACLESAGCNIPLPTVTGIASTGGRIYIAGEFTGVNDQECNSVVALDRASGQLAPGFSCPRLGDDKLFDLELQVAGPTLYLGGDFKTVNDEQRNGFAVFGADSGSLLDNWSPSSVTDYVAGLSVSGSSVLVSGVEEGGR